MDWMVLLPNDVLGEEGPSPGLEAEQVVEPTAERDKLLLREVIGGGERIEIARTITTVRISKKEEVENRIKITMLVLMLMQMQMKMFINNMAMMTIMTKELGLN
jgi:hypothetical protein